MILQKYNHSILAIGSPLMIHRLRARIGTEQFTVTGCQNPVEAAALLRREQYDMVVIDNRTENAEVICSGAALNRDTPVALLLQEKPVNWRDSARLAVDFFLADAGTDMEFNARVRACLRRKAALCRC